MAEDYGGGQAVGISLERGCLQRLKFTADTPVALRWAPSAARMGPFSCIIFNTSSDWSASCLDETIIKKGRLLNVTYILWTYMLVMNCITIRQ